MINKNRCTAQQNQMKNKAKKLIAESDVCQKIMKTRNEHTISFKTFDDGLKSLKNLNNLDKA